MRTKSMLTAVMALVAMALVVFAGTARAGLIVTNLGDRGDGKILVQISYDGTGGNTGTWTVPVGITSVEVLVVGGGGGGAHGGWNPGGGAGGLYYSDNWSVSGSVAIQVGLGGTANGGNGGQSSFGDIIAYGGQGGGVAGIGIGGAQGGHSTDGGTTVVAGFAGGASSGGSGGGATEAGTRSAGGWAYGGAGWTDIITGNIGVVDANGDAIYGPLGNKLTGFAGGGTNGPGAEWNDPWTLGLHGEGYGGGTSRAQYVVPYAGIDLTGGGGAGGRDALSSDGGDGVIYIAYIPEPGTGLLLLGAAVALGLLRRRQWKR